MSSSAFGNDQLTHKRFFLPVSGTRFNDIKKRKLTNGVECVKSRFDNSLSTEERDLMQIEQEKLEIERQKIYNYAIYQKSKEAFTLNLSHTYTTPQPFNLRTEQRAEIKSHEPDFKDIQNRPIFKARSIPKNLIQPPVIMHSEKQLTIPQEFKLSSRGFSKSNLSDNCQKAQNSINDSVSNHNDSFENSGHRATAVPDFSSPYTPTKQSASRKSESLKSKTEERGSAKKVKFEQHDQHKRHEVERPFKAQPLPEFTPPTQRSHEHSITTPSPFSFSERIGPEKQLSYSSDRFQSFKARPMPNFSRPFFPQSNNIDLTQPMEIELHTERRAEVRNFFQDKSSHLMNKLDEHNQRIRNQQEIHLNRKTLNFRTKNVPGLNRGTRSAYESLNTTQNMFYSQNVSMEADTSVIKDEEMTDA